MHIVEFIESRAPPRLLARGPARRPARRPAREPLFDLFRTDGVDSGVLRNARYTLKFRRRRGLGLHGGRGLGLHDGRGISCHGRLCSGGSNDLPVSTYAIMARRHRRQRRRVQEDESGCGAAVGGSVAVLVVDLLQPCSG